MNKKDNWVAGLKIVFDALKDFQRHFPGQKPEAFEVPDEIHGHFMTGARRAIDLKEIPIKAMLNSLDNIRINKSDRATRNKKIIAWLNGKATLEWPVQSLFLPVQTFAERIGFVNRNLENEHKKN